MRLEVAPCGVNVEVGQRRVVGPGPGHQHVVDRTRKVVEERRQPREVGGVEGRDARRADVVRRVLQARVIAARDHDVGSFRAGESGRLEPDA